jgi:hypothetical protein
MGLREVKEVIDSLDGLPDGLLLGKRARDLSIGDLRLLYRYASLMGVEYAEHERSVRPMDDARIHLRDD